MSGQHGDVNRLSRINVHSSYNDQRIDTVDGYGNSGKLSEYSALLGHYRFWGLNQSANEVADVDMQLQMQQSQQSSIIYTYAYTVLCIISLLLLCAGYISYERHAYDLSVVLPPVILIPDLFCSKLEFIVRTAKHGESVHPDLSACTKSSHYYYTSIYNTSLLHAPVSSCLVAALSMKYDETTGDFINQPTVRVQTVRNQFGSLDSIIETQPLYTPIQTPYAMHDAEDYNYMSSFYTYYYNSASDTSATASYTPCQYKRLFNKLINMGYEPGVTLFAAPYDWRRAAPSMKTHEFVTPLKHLIETAVKTNGRRARLLTHGAGTDHALYFTEQMKNSWLQRYVKHIIALDGDIAGNREYALPIVTGLSIQAQRVLPLVPEQLIAIWQSMSYYAWKLPVYQPVPMADIPVVDTPAKYYTTSSMSDVRDLLTRAGATDLAKLLKPFKSMQQYTVPKVNLIGILPSPVPVFKTYVFNENDLLTLPSVIYTLSDKQNSLSWLLHQWQSQTTDTQINITYVTGATRQLLPASNDVFDTISELLGTSHHRHRKRDQYKRVSQPE